MMTSEKAIQLLHRLQDEQFDGEYGDERREALEMAVRALSGDGDTIYRQDVLKILSSKNAAWDAYDKVKQLPSAQPEACDDAISRKMAIDAVAKWFYDVFGITESDGTATIFKRLRELPSAQPQRWDTCFSCPLSHGCPVIKGCTNDQAEQYAGEIPTDCPLDKESAQPELLEHEAYIRGFEQGRTQGMIDAKEGKK